MWEYKKPKYFKCLLLTYFIRDDAATHLLLLTEHQLGDHNVSQGGCCYAHGVYRINLQGLILMFLHSVSTRQIPEGLCTPPAGSPPPPPIERT